MGSLPPTVRNVTPARYRSWTRGALVALTVIVVSGGAVRLTGSGLGCSDWPNCENDQFVADLEYHNLIEFGNRLFTGVVTVAVVMAVLGSLGRVPRRNDLTRWSWGLVVGVAAQIVLGGILVKTELDPRFNMGHFLLSMVLLANATVLHHLAAWPDGDDGERLAPSSTDPPPVVGRLRDLVRAVGLVGVGLLVTGTIVTGSGPHSGSDEPEVAARLPFLVRDVTRIHSIVAICLLALVLTVVWAAHNDGNWKLRRHAETVAALLVVQGGIGYLQYFTGVPVLLVAVHLTLASITWIAIVRLYLELRPVPIPATRPQPVT
jgi:cytochrome c oxidase assembly protein subunit 15